MTSSNKLQIVAGGLVLLTILSNSLLLLFAENTNLAKMALQISFAVIFSYALIQRARWARWTVGILSGMGVILTPLLLALSWEQSSRIFSSWLGIHVVALFIFHSWASYTLLFDKHVSLLFRVNRNQQTTI